MFAQPAAGQPPWAARSTVPSSVRCTGRSGRGRAGVIELVIKLNNFEAERSTRLRPLCTFNGLRAEALCPGLRVGHPGAHRPINARSDIPLPPSHVAFAITTSASVVMRSFNAQLQCAASSRNDMPALPALQFTTRHICLPLARAHDQPHIPQTHLEPSKRHVAIKRHQA